MMLNAESQDVLKCRAHIIGAPGGRTTECEGNGYKFSPLSTLQSNYECSGSTTRTSCRFVGLSQVGEELGAVDKILQATPEIEIGLQVKANVTALVEDVPSLLV